MATNPTHVDTVAMNVAQNGAFLFISLGVPSSCVRCNDQHVVAGTGQSGVTVPTIGSLTALCSGMAAEIVASVSLSWMLARSRGHSHNRGWVLPTTAASGGTKYLGDGSFQAAKLVYRKESFLYDGHL